MDNRLLFEERQFLGRNKQSNFVRVILALTCFAAYYWSTYRDLSGKLFLILGISIIVFSILLAFTMHFKTRLYEGYIELARFFSLQKIKIPIQSIELAEVVNYDEFYINNAVFNLHLKGKIHFYTSGQQAVKITDKDGLIYLIGSRQSGILANIIQKQIESNSGKLTDDR